MADGTVYDLAYKSYTGTRTSLSYRWTVIARTAMRLQLRQSWVKVLLVFSLPLLAVRAILMAGSAVFSAVDAGPRADLAVATYGVPAQSFTTFLLLLVCGAPAIASDLNAGAFQFYFSRPLSPWQYLLGRIASSSAWALTLSLGSLGVLALERIALGGSLPSVARVVLFASLPVVLRVLSVTAVSLAASSLTRRKGIAQASFAGTVVASYSLTLVLARVEDQPWVRWLDVTAGAEALANQFLSVIHPPGWQALVPVTATLVWIVASLSIAYTRLCRAEVVRG